MKERLIQIPESVVEKLLERKYLDEVEFQMILAQMPENWRHDYLKTLPPRKEEEV